MFDADDFAGDWYGHVINQGAHFCVGLVAAFVLFPFSGLYATPIIIAAIYYVAWERIIQHGKLWADSIEDTAHVMSGASVICGALVSYWTAAVCLMGWLALLALGVWRRM